MCSDVQQSIILYMKEQLKIWVPQWSSEYTIIICGTHFFSFLEAFVFFFDAFFHWSSHYKLLDLSQIGGFFSLVKKDIFLGPKALAWGAYPLGRPWVSTFLKSYLHFCEHFLFIFLLFWNLPSCFASASP